MRTHLKNVYATFTLATIAAAAGGYAHMFSTLIGAGLMTGLGAIGALIWLTITPYDGKNQLQRLSLLGAFAFLTGCNLGPLLSLAVMVNPALVSRNIAWRIYFSKTLGPNHPFKFGKHGATKGVLFSCL